MSKTRTGAELFTEALERYGVRYLFGNPGTTELPIIDSVAESSLEYVMALHEDVAVGAAAGYANRKRYHETEQPGEMLGVVNLHTTPGLAHGIGNTYGAMFSDAPVLVTTGSLRPEHEKKFPPLGGERKKLVEEFTKSACRIESVKELAEATRKAVKNALTPPTGPVFLDIPVTVQKEETDADVEPLGAIPEPGPADSQGADMAAEKLIGADEPVMVVGNRLAHAGEEAVEKAEKLADKLGVRVHGEPMLSEVSFSTDHDNWVSVLDVHSAEMAADLATDTVFFVGCCTETPVFSDGENVLKDSTTVIQAGIDGCEVSNVYQSDVSLVGNLTEVLGQILDRVEGGIEEEIRAERLENIHEKRSAVLKEIKDAVPETGGRPSQLALCRSIDDSLGEAVVVDEGVTTGFILRKAVSLEYGQLQGLKSGGLGYGLPAAVGAAVAEESRDKPRPVLGLIGDGSFQYYPQALHTAKRSVDAALTVVVPENEGYKILREAGIADDERPLSFGAGIDLVANASSYGMAAETLDSDGIASKLSAALEADENRFLAVPVGSDLVFVD